MTKLTKIRESLEKAEVGPWSMVRFINGRTFEVWQSVDNTGIARIIGSENAEANAHLIANAPEWLKYLLDQNKSLQQRVNTLTEALEFYADKHNYIEDQVDGHCNVTRDFGFKADEALQSIKESPREEKILRTVCPLVEHKYQEPIDTVLESGMVK